MERCQSPSVNMKWIITALHYFVGLGSFSGRWGSAITAIYNVAFALSLSVLGVIVYLEEKLLYKGFSIYATCLRFVAFYVGILAACVTVVHGTYNRRHLLALQREIEQFFEEFRKTFPYTTLSSSRRPVLVAIILYSVAVPCVVSLEDQFVSGSFTLSCYLTTLISLLHTDHVVALLTTCRDTFEGLNQYIYAETKPHLSTLERISIALSSRLINLDVGLNEMMQKHREIGSLTVKVAKAFTLTVGLQFLSTTFAFTVLVYTILMRFISQIQTRVSRYSAIYTLDLETALHCLQVFFIVRAAENATRSANRIAIVLHSLRGLHPYFGGETFNEYSLQLLNEKLELTLAGVFAIDFSLLTGTAVVFTTLVIISLQSDEDFLVTNPKTMQIWTKQNRTGGNDVV
ncbi:hypothetical protein PPYR_03369 [Photinus pyralis]|uniref:Gustatory receptor n=1 Tax=Photinus pyralis TaxID=7054 RepID=A0A5N4A2R7_PHOPY|nr:uncharacterized protein LOC116162087 [Photinus pyralis]KAB0791569.1 hypothetical protein PPYR_03369 [Photinus pyralis]